MPTSLFYSFPAPTCISLSWHISNEYNWCKLNAFELQHNFTMKMSFVYRHQTGIFKTHHCITWYNYNRGYNKSTKRTRPSFASSLAKCFWSTLFPTTKRCVSKALDVGRWSFGVKMTLMGHTLKKILNSWLFLFLKFYDVPHESFYVYPENKYDPKNKNTYDFWVGISTVIKIFWHFLF